MVRIGTKQIHGTDSSHPRALGIPIGQHHGLAKQPPRRSRWWSSHSVKGPYCLRGLAPQSLFVVARAVKQGRGKIGEAQETLGDGAGLRPSTGRRRQKSGWQRFLVADRQIVMSVRARTFAMAIGPGGSLEYPGLAGSAGRVLPAGGPTFALAGFDRGGATKSPQQACQPMSERKLER
jgi:hypothetical protein